MSKPKRNMKKYPRGTKTDTEVRMEDKKIQIQTKWNNDLKEEKTIPKKGNSHERKIVIVNKKIFLILPAVMTTNSGYIASSIHILNL
jgi:hypothetical protein